MPFAPELAFFLFRMAVPSLRNFVLKSLDIGCKVFQLVPIGETKKDGGHGDGWTRRLGDSLQPPEFSSAVVAEDLTGIHD
jgi:hypothetical protein